MADQAARLAYAHGSAFTTEPLEAYAARSDATCRSTIRRSIPCRAARRRSRRRSSSRGPTTSPAARRTVTSSSRGGGATTATRSAPSTCRVARRCAGRTSRGSAGSCTCRRPTRTAPDRPGSHALADGAASPTSSTRRSSRPVPARVAAFVAEPIVGRDARRGSPARRLLAGRIAEVCRRHGVLLVADEVMTGFGRTGRWFASDHWGVRPDMLVAAKGATSGYWPFGFVAASGDDPRGRDRRRRVRPRVHLLAQPGRRPPSPREVLRILESEDLVAASAPKGERLRALLDARLGEHAAVGEIRGRGLLVGRRARRRPRDAGRRSLEPHA